MTEKDQHDLDQRRVKRLEQAIASGDKEAIRRAGGQRGREAAEARKRLQVRRVAREQREKRAADTAERKVEQPGKEPQGRASGRTSPTAARGQTAERSSTPLRDAAIARQQAMAAQRQRDRADVRSR